MCTNNTEYDCYLLAQFALVLQEFLVLSVLFETKGYNVTQKSTLFYKILNISHLVWLIN